MQTPEMLKPNQSSKKCLTLTKCFLTLTNERATTNLVKQELAVVAIPETHLVAEAPVDSVTFLRHSSVEVRHSVAAVNGNSRGHLEVKMLKL